MKIFSKDLKEEIKDIDYNSGKIIVGRVSFEDITETDVLPNGLVTNTGESSNITEDIGIFVPFTEQEQLDNFRYRRDRECFSIINRGILWYETLTEKQKAELKAWYNAWLDVTETKEVPTKPEWLDK